MKKITLQILLACAALSIANSDAIARGGQSGHHTHEHTAETAKAKEEAKTKLNTDCKVGCNKKFDSEELVCKKKQDPEKGNCRSFNSRVELDCKQNCDAQSPLP